MLIVLGILLLTVAAGNARQAHIRHWRQADEYETAAVVLGWAGITAVVAGMAL